ncbi:MAG: protein kinase [Acidobacteriota bacterium]
MEYISKLFNFISQNIYIKYAIYAILLIILIRFISLFLRIFFRIFSTDTSSKITEAKRLEKLGNFYGAGMIYEEIGRYEKASECYLKAKNFNACAKMHEKLGKYYEAKKMYLKAENYSKAASMVLLKPEKTSLDFEESAEIYIRGRFYKEALDLLLKIKNFRKVAEIFESLKNYEDAAIYYEKAQMLEKAAENYERNFYHIKNQKLGEILDESEKVHLIKAAKTWEKLGNVKKAISLLEKERLNEELAELLERKNMWKEAAELWEKKEKFLKAAECYEKADELKRSHLMRARHFYEEGNYSESAKHFEEAGDLVRAAEDYEVTNDFHKSGELYKLLGNYVKAAENFFKAGEKHKAAKMFELAEEFESAGKIYAELRDFAKAEEMYGKAGNYFEAGKLTLNTGDEEKALEFFQRVKSTDENYDEAQRLIAEIFFKREEYKLAFERFTQILENSEISEKNLESFYHFGICSEKLSEYNTAIELYRKILNKDYNFKDVRERLENLMNLTIEVKELIETPETEERYRIIQRIGKGGMGTVYKAEDLLLKRVVALKILKRENLEDSRSIERFYLEARAAAALNHPNIVTIFDVGKFKENYFISMEYIEGKTMQELLKEKNFISFDEFFFVSLNLFHALNYAHNKNVIHRDIKPQNIMVSKENQVKVMDFGLAIILSEYKKGETGMITGTPLYMAPEQIRGEGIDRRVDIYSSGATLFHLITGKPLFSGDNVLYKHIFDPPDKPSSIRSDVPEEIDFFILKCLEKRKEDRFQSASEAISHLEKIRKNN